MKLNNLVKTNKKKIRPGEVSAPVKAKPLEEDIKVKNLDLVWQSKVLRVDKCRYLEDYPKEDSNQSENLALRF